MLAHDATSVGASGGVMGLVGFLLVLTLRPSSETPEFIRSAVLASIGAIALIGLAGWKYVDNAGHAGGALAGLLIGLVFVPRRGGPITPRRAAWIDALGWIAAAVLAAGAVVTAVKLIQMRLHR